MVWQVGNMCVHIGIDGTDKNCSRSAYYSSLPIRENNESHYNSNNYSSHPPALSLSNLARSPNSFGFMAENKAKTARPIWLQCLIGASSNILYSAYMPRQTTRCEPKLTLLISPLMGNALFPGWPHHLTFSEGVSIGILVVGMTRPALVSWLRAIWCFDTFVPFGDPGI